MTDKLKIGIIGAGGILNAHAPAAQALSDRCEVTCVAEPAEEKYSSIREKLGCSPSFYPGWDELLENERIDAAVILLPHHLHMPAAAACAEAGVHVLVEKVMARNIYECDLMIEACENAGVTLTVSHDRRYGSDWRALKRIIDSGILGDIHFYRLDHNQDVNPIERGFAWAADRDKLGGGAIMSCLTHQIDALRWYGGEIDGVQGMTRVFPERMEGETIGLMFCRMTSGAIAELTINWMTRQNQGGTNSLHYESVHVFGSEGEAYYMSGKGSFVRLNDPLNLKKLSLDSGAVTEKDFVQMPVEKEHGQTVLWREWLKRIKGEDNGITTKGRDAKKTVEAAEAVYRSEEHHREVRLPLEPVPCGTRESNQ